MNELVSIVVTDHNYGRYVGEAIDSALGQSHAPVEVLVVDDGSTDDSREVIARRGVRVIAQAQGGVCRARNRGALECKGGLLMFLDADDVLEREYVARCREALLGAPPNVAYAYTGMRLFGDQNGVFEAPAFSAAALLQDNFIHASALMRRAAFDRVGGYNPRFALGREDQDLWVRMLDHGLIGVLVPGPLLRYRRHGQTRDQLSPRQLDELFWRLRLSYPRLYWRKYLRHPLDAAQWFLRLRGEIDRPRRLGAGGG